jgi:hypothetical protein
MIDPVYLDPYIDRPCCRCCRPVAVLQPFTIQLAINKDPKLNTTSIFKQNLVSALALNKWIWKVHEWRRMIDDDPVHLHAAHSGTASPRPKRTVFTCTYRSKTSAGPCLKSKLLYREA